MVFNIVSNLYYFNTHNLLFFLHRTDPTIVRLGEHNLKLRGETEIQDFEINQIIKYPNYKPPKKYHDIALLQLKKRAV